MRPENQNLKFQIIFLFLVVFSNAFDRRNKTQVEIKRWSMNNNENAKKAFIELKMLKVS